MVKLHRKAWGCSTCPVVGCDWTTKAKRMSMQAGYLRKHLIETHGEATFKADVLANDAMFADKYAVAFKQQFGVDAKAYRDLTATITVS